MNSIDLSFIVEEGRIWQWNGNEIPKLEFSIPIQFNTIACGYSYFMGLSSKYFQFNSFITFYLTQYFPLKKEMDIFTVGGRMYIMNLVIVTMNIMNLVMVTMKIENHQHVLNHWQ